MSAEHAYTRIKLFLTKRQRFALPQKKLDGLLQGIVDKFPAIHGIELVEVEQSLTNEQMHAAAKDADAELTELRNSLDEYLDQQGQLKH